MSLQKNRLRSVKNVLFFFIVHFSRQTNGGGFEPPKPPLRTPLFLLNPKQPRLLKTRWCMKHYSLLIAPTNQKIANACVLSKDGSTVRYASIFAKKYGTLVRYAFFCNGTGTLRWYGTPFVWWCGYGTLVRCFNFRICLLNVFMCKVRPSMKIRATVPDVHIV